MSTSFGEQPHEEARKPCPTSEALLAQNAVIQFEKLMLTEFLDEDQSLDDTIDNLTQLLERMACVTHQVSTSTLFHARRSLVSLESLKLTMKA